MRWRHSAEAGCKCPAKRLPRQPEWTRVLPIRPGASTPIARGRGSAGSAAPRRWPRVGAFRLWPGVGGPCRHRVPQVCGGASLNGLPGNAELRLQRCVGGSRFPLVADYLPSSSVSLGMSLPPISGWKLLRTRNSAEGGRNALSKGAASTRAVTNIVASAACSPERRAVNLSYA